MFYTIDIQHLSDNQNQCFALVEVVQIQVPKK